VIEQVDVRTLKVVATVPSQSEADDSASGRHAVVHEDIGGDLFRDTGQSYRRKLGHSQARPNPQSSKQQSIFRVELKHIRG
jgi:hypothetical protein